MTERTAIVLLNLGGPDSLAAVRPFLYNLFSDPDIIQLPFGRAVQKIFAALIAWRRAPEAMKGYAAIGGRSPLLAHTQAQAQALQQVLATAAPALHAATGSGAAPVARRQDVPAAPEVFVCMRYWHPHADEVVARLRQNGCTRIVLLPLYPHYSRTTTGSSFNDFKRACAQQGYRPELLQIEHWYDQPQYQQAVVETLRAELMKFPDPVPERIEVLFSAHGLPQKLVDRGDPYERQIRATYEALRARFNWPHTTLCYQSRVGPLAWLKPYTDEVIAAKAAGGARQILVYPIAFVSDHVETLYELGITYAELARARGVAHYRVAPALNTHPLLIQALAQLVRARLS